MNKQKKSIAAIFYVAGLLFILWGAFFQVELSFIKMSIGSALLFIPWIMCLLSAYKKKDNSFLWMIFLIFQGVLAIPIYLITVKEHHIPHQE